MRRSDARPEVAAAASPALSSVRMGAGLSEGLRAILEDGTFEGDCEMVDAAPACGDPRDDGAAAAAAAAAGAAPPLCVASAETSVVGGGGVSSRGGVAAATGT